MGRVHRFFEWSAIDILHYRKHSCLRVFLAAHHSEKLFVGVCESRWCCDILHCCIILLLQIVQYFGELQGF
ncbi:hypothetical protein HOLleu_26820 [Holothuria leucospilota]|uniref:Uncharacterized protein n=1 Tax=Holothuria leucospilota TaxID=206669 RepID=A0A9Q1BPG7_HOLLE|nr:hypothetical protein HOLleu_26820 [Holothuria leucospilota]